MAAEPRELVAAVGQPVEMEKHGKRTFCCGAGGAHMWMEERGSQINEERVRQATETGASTLAVACPFCTVMLDDGVRSAGADIEVVDVATLLVQAVERGGTKPAPDVAPGASRQIDRRQWRGMHVPIELAVLVAVFVVGAIAAAFADRIGAPALLLFLGLGIFLGVDGPGGIEFDDATLVRDVGTGALALILFEGGALAEPGR